MRPRRGRWRAAASTPPRPGSAPRAPGAHGSTLVEALAALALLALAASVVAAAAAANLRALSGAVVLERLVALAARELALAQARGAPVTSEDTTALDPDLGVVARHLEVARDADGVAALAVRVTAPNTPPLDLRTRMQTAE
ncbi:MAG: hypothetical protein HY271_15005 [Deltaproteobacteria bacterium]|nr:hypothetical protein [Deltaproteobacteria bacterium]